MITKAKRLLLIVPELERAYKRKWRRLYQAIIVINQKIIICVSTINNGFKITSD